MGCFGYICKGCGTSIRGNCFTGGEKCVMIHVRHGEEMGRVEGHYDEYGRVIEQENLENEDLVFRGEGEGINSHHEICKSEFEFEDSHYSAINTKIFNGKKATPGSISFVPSVGGLIIASVVINDLLNKK